MFSATSGWGGKKEKKRRGIQQKSVHLARRGGEVGEALGLRWGGSYLGEGKGEERYTNRRSSIKHGRGTEGGEKTGGAGGSIRKRVRKKEERSTITMSGRPRNSDEKR